MSSKIESIKMSNGLDFPLLGFGTFLRTRKASDAQELKNALEVAVDAGYRHIDTAQLYGLEDVIGEFLQEKIQKSGLKRSDFFITTKLWITDFEVSAAEKMIKKQLELLKTDYIDLYLLHGPTPVSVKGGHMVPELIPHIDTWRVLEKYYKLGVFKAIGLSNFNQEQVDELYKQAEIKPMNLQVECHAYFQQKKLSAYCQENHITFTSYATIGSPARGVTVGANGYPPADWHTQEPLPLELPLVKELAKKYSKSPAQILLRQMMQRGIAIIPKSVTPSRIRENIDIFDFELTEEEMKKFAEIDDGARLFDWNYVSGHPFHPFEVHYGS